MERVDQESQESQSDQLSESDVGEAGENEAGQEDGARARKSPNRPSAKDPTFEVLLKVVETMQTMQKTMMKSSDEFGGEAEVVRVSPQLPKLPEWCSETAPIDFGDWITCLEVHMADLSTSSEQWWSLMMKTVTSWYSHHMTLTPIQRLTHQPTMPDELKAKRWGRLERRAASLLMSALPEALKEEIIASKSVSALGILSKAMLQYQPGGLGERGAILQALESPSESPTVATAITQLRKWIRWKRRALEMGVSIPDSSILMRGLGRLMKKLVSTYPDLNFRLSLVRNTLLVDTVPTMESVTQYSEHLLAELEQMGQHAKKREAPMDNQPKLRKFEEGVKEDERPRPKGRLLEEVEGKKKPCKFFLTDSGCKRGRNCQFGHMPDDQKRCWSCGSKEHMAPSCPRAESAKPKVAKVQPKTNDKDSASTSTATATVMEKPEPPAESKSPAEGAGEDTMKTLIDEANRMLRSLQTDPKEKAVSTRVNEEKMAQLQKQLDDLKKAALRPFRLSKISCSASHGLLDSGATHPLRPKRQGERVHHLPRVDVTLAGDQQVSMSLAPTGVIIGDEHAEPIVPMGLLTTALGCTVNWTKDGLSVLHPQHGPLDIKLQNGCPVVPYSMALTLINELENLATIGLKSLSGDPGDSEVQWLRRLVDEHPVFAPLPAHLRDALVEKPASNLVPLGNRRLRKAWKKHGMMVHMYSGSNDGYTLKRAFHEVGGDKRLLHELDVLHGQPESDMSQTGAAYPLMLRLALDGMCKAWVGGPPCRTRSMLRHIEIPGIDMPRPLRALNGQEFGREDLTEAEKNLVFQDDVLMLRFLLLYVISEEVRKATNLESSVSLLLEQPANLASHPEVVTIWRTPIWTKLMKLYDLKSQTFCQSEFGALATKPTTIGGTMSLQVPLPGRRGVPRVTEGKTKEQICSESSSLSRWPPMMMRSIAECLQKETMKQEVKLRALSWKEHIAAGHTPFRKDCLICQQSSAKDQHHRRSKLPPRAGVLSLDLSGPFKVAPDLHSRSAKYLLVGAFTWISKDQMADDFEELDIPEVAQEAPEIEDLDEVEDVEEAPLPPLRDEDDVWGELQEQREEQQRERAERRGMADQEGESEKGLEEKEEAEEERKDPRITVTRLCTPIQSKSQNDVLRAIIDMYLRLRSDGYIVTQIHTDRGGEFMSSALDRWCTSRTILHTFTPGDQPQSNGRVEVAVQWVKSEIRRILHAAGAPFERWPLAARNLNERLRLRQVGKDVKLPTFLSSVLIRKRFWRAQELLPTQEEAKYISPSWVHHGHWIQRQDGSFALTRMVMHQLTNPPTDDDWIGLEDELAPTEVRRRIRGKVALNHLSFEDSLQEGEVPEEMKEEEEREKEVRETRKIIEEEMKHAVLEEPLGAFFTLDAISSLKEMSVNTTTEEVLQTRIVAQSEVRKHLPEWIGPIKSELKALFETKGALRRIEPQRVQELLAEGKAEILPSKMVWTVKPSPDDKRGKKKARLVACGNFQAGEPDQEALFAGGATAVALRASLALASQFGWSGTVTDIKTAFLNAPMKLGGNQHGEQTNEVKVAIIKPPPLLVLAGLASPDEHWEVVMALYGYKESPRLWSDFRDDQLTSMKFPMDEHTAELVAPGAGTVSSCPSSRTKATVGAEPSLGSASSHEQLKTFSTFNSAVCQGDVSEKSSSTTSWLVLDQMITEPNMWRILKYQPGPFGPTQANQLVGLLLVYVDDFLVLGSDAVIKSVIDVLQAKWETSIPENINSSSGVRFLGAELFTDGVKWWMTQRNYIQDLLVRNLGGDSSSWPTRKIPMACEPELREDPPGRNPSNVKEAQRVVGELVWISTRTRPDLSYCVNKLAGMITKDPLQVVELARNIWYYLAGSLDHGLQFQNEANENQLNIYTDASFGELCTGCHLVMWGESMLLWKSGKQSVVTASTAEAELVEILEGSLAGDAVRVVLEEALDERCRAVSFSDNMASISIVVGDSGSWRTRHLKKRAHILKTKVVQGDWLLRHLAGTELPADLGTKVLSAEKFKYHKIKMGMYMGNDEKDVKCDGDEKVKGSSKVEKTKQALKAIILFAQMAIAKSEENDQLSIWEPSFPLRSFTDPSSGIPFFFIIIMIFVFGVLIGAILMWLAVYPFFHRVTLVSSQSNVVPRPTFLMEYFPERSGRSENDAPRPRNQSRSTSTEVRQTAVSAAAGGSAGRAESSNLGAADAAVHSAGRAESSNLGAADAAVHSAGWAESSNPGAADAAERSAGRAESSSRSASEAVRDSRSRRRTGVSRDFPLYVSPAGERYHFDPTCRGLRHARTFQSCPRCPDCFPTQSRLNSNLFGLGPGSLLHGDSNHVQRGEIRQYGPCAICVPSSVVTQD